MFEAADGLLDQSVYQTIEKEKQLAAAGRSYP